MPIDENPPHAEAWIPLSGPGSYPPPDEQFVLLLGFARTPPVPVVRTGRRWETFRPAIEGRIRWLDAYNDALTADGFEPSHWLPLDALPRLPGPGLLTDARLLDTAELLAAARKALDAVDDLREVPEVEALARAVRAFNR